MAKRRYYFAAQYDRHPEMRAYRAELIERIPNAEVTSGWIDMHKGTLPVAFSADMLNIGPEVCRPYAESDLTDIEHADILVLFTTVDGKANGRGGRHVETGYAIARGMPIVIIGPRENVFHTLPGIEVYSDWQTYLDTVTAYGAEGR